MEYIHVEHLFGPVYNKDSKILILGSFPSVKSREQNFYYGHPRNRFWKVLDNVYGNIDSDLHTVIAGISDSNSIEVKKKFLLDNGVALWDVIGSCDIKGSSDSSIKNIKVNDISEILNAADIEKIILNGGKAYELFIRYCYREGMPDSVKLPSTSPANAAWGIDKLVEAWKKEIAELL